ncbi:MAG: hypothetical protein JW781_02215, partial [Deltaproteobacteria bacterium]|nr:hypothetical protein [Candidatus Anaeroferrophillacea bacterium]
MLISLMNFAFPPQLVLDHGTQGLGIKQGAPTEPHHPALSRVRFAVMDQLAQKRQAEASEIPGNSGDFFGIFGRLFDCHPGFTGDGNEITTETGRHIDVRLMAPLCI